MELAIPNKEGHLSRIFKLLEILHAVDEQDITDNPSCILRAYRFQPNLGIQGHVVHVMLKQISRQYNLSHYMPSFTLQNVYLSTREIVSINGGPHFRRMNSCRAILYAATKIHFF